MSSGRKLTLAAADEIAAAVADVLEPTVQRLQVVGSVRRRRPRVGDLEFLAEPYYDVGLFDGSAPITDPVEKALRTLGTWVKGGQRLMVVRDVLGRAGFRVEVNLVHPPSTWGTLLGIRTGPRELGKYVVTQCRRNGYRIDRGAALEIGSGKPVPTETEAQFFALADAECRPPEHRDGYAIELWNDLNRYQHGARA